MNGLPTAVIADDHELLRAAMADLVAVPAGLRVVASVRDAQAAVWACTENKPNLLLLDIEMPGKDPLAAIKEVAACSPSTRVVILSSHCQDSFILLAARAGVAGYLLKTDGPASLVNYLRKIVQGETAWSDSVRERLSASKESHSAESKLARVANLTPRELEVLRYIGRGYDNDSMAQYMHLSKRTVERHVARLMEAMGIHDRSSLVKLSTESGFLS